jgi:hypothetical protein
MKRLRSLKIDIPPAAELAGARREIFDSLKSLDPKRDKIKLVCTSEAEQRRAEEIVEDIAKLLRIHQQPEQERVYTYNPAFPE